MNFKSNRRNACESENPEWGMCGNVNKEETC